ncbi:MAG TPA: SDR family oxidoreductase [Candidatus Cybelea sp.]|nr:SDR family oxidoreductase [Candidatus Cybelea sp.]
MALEGKRRELMGKGNHLVPSPRLFCFGFGYCAEALAARLSPRGFRIAGTCRTESKRAALAARGIEAFLFDRDRPLDDARTALADATHVLSSVPPDSFGDPVLDHHGDDLGAQGSVVWAGYLSTTGVYGDRAGDWVDETSPLQPSTERGRRRAAAEAEWLATWRRHKLPVHVFRLAGIYGPGRNQVETARAGSAQRIDKPGQVFSRIHVEDVAAVLQASMVHPNPGAVYNVCDDEPAPPADVVAFACALIGIEPPPLVPFERAKLSEMGRSFFSESKRVSNGRIKAELGVRLRYPSYRQGLQALAAGARPAAD